MCLACFLSGQQAIGGWHHKYHRHRPNASIIHLCAIFYLFTLVTPIILSHTFAQTLFANDSNFEVNNPQFEINPNEDFEGTTTSLYSSSDEAEYRFSGVEAPDNWSNGDQNMLMLNVTPSNPVANCTDIELRCAIVLVDNSQQFTSVAISPIWWTFKGKNISASTLHGGRVNSEANSTVSILNIECAQFAFHNGDYQCHWAYSDTTIHSPHLSLEIYVPPTLEQTEPENGTIRQQIETKVQLKCSVLAHPKPKIIWQRTDLNTLAVSDIEMDGRIVIDSNSRPYINNQHESDTLTTLKLSIVESILTFKSLMRHDNGSYSCKVISIFDKPFLVHFNVIVLEVPEIYLEKLEIENKTNVMVTFVLKYDGNLPVDNYYLEMINYTSTSPVWVNQHVSTNQVLTNGHNYSSIVISHLMPGASYGFKLTAHNHVGQSEWSYMNISVPPDVPSSINNVHLLSKTNGTLMFGWHRPLYDNGAAIIKYQMMLKNNEDGIFVNQTLDISNSSQQSHKYMYVFPNLMPGSRYTFQVRACSNIGCSEWSALLDSVTSDGHADPPLNVLLHCDNYNNATITWESPTNPRGSIVGYNITLEGHANYKNSMNKLVLDQFREFHEVMDNQTFLLRVSLKANSNYTVRLCAINKSGCGQLSHITSSAMCQSRVSIPTKFPPNIHFEHFTSSAMKGSDNSEVHISPFTASRQLKLLVPRVSERNGPIKCYRIIMIRLPQVANTVGHNDSLNDSSNDYYSDYILANPDTIPLSTYKLVHDIRRGSSGAYVATEFSSENFQNEIIIGNGKTDRCRMDEDYGYDLRLRIKFGGSSSEDNRSPRRIDYSTGNQVMRKQDQSNLSLVENGELLTKTNYTAMIEVTVLANNGTLLVGRSPLLEPIETEPLHLVLPELSKSAFSETTTGILFGTACGLLLVLGLLFSVLCFLKRKATEATPILLNESIGLTSIIRQTIGGKRKGSLFYQINFNSSSSIQKWASKPILVENFSMVFQEKHANSGFLFQAEFEALPEHFTDRTTINSDSPMNACKNRYPDIKCYDQTRVVLSLKDGVSESNYINANFVTGFRKDKQFICAQGPLEKTIGDFWRLIDEHQCSIIVMLTGIEEQGRIKCAQYWDETETMQVTDYLQVITTSRHDYSDYIIRHLCLRNSITNQARDILHFHFVGWKDFMAPEQPSWLLRFIKRVNEHYCADKGPIVVHCSAGVGRTGTFIAIDSLIAHIDDGARHINVFNCVCQLRHQRNYLVQSIKQYIFVYRAIMEYIDFGDTEIEATHLSQHYKQLKEDTFDTGNALIIEFEKFNDVFEEAKSCIVGTMDMNQNKNRYPFIIPYDINRVILNPSGSKDNSYYINASFIQGYDHSLSFIVAQDPMEHTVNEFWLMIAEHRVTTMVMLAELGEGQSKCYCYWSNDEFDCNLVKVKLIEEEMFQYYTKRVFEVTKKKSGESHQLSQYQFLAWKNAVVPESTTALITLADEILARKESTPPPILVHCSGGGDRSSVFVAFTSLVMQLRLEERVDIFQTARYIKSQRQSQLQTIAQYDFLYRCLIDYIEYHHIGDKSDIHV